MQKVGKKKLFEFGGTVLDLTKIIWIDSIQPRTSPDTKDPTKNVTIGLFSITFENQLKLSYGNEDQKDVQAAREILMAAWARSIDDLPEEKPNPVVVPVQNTKKTTAKKAPASRKK